MYFSCIPRELLLIVGLSWAAIATLFLFVFFLRLRYIKRQLIRTVSKGKTPTPKYSFGEIISHLHAIISNQRNLLTRNTQTRAQLLDITRSAGQLKKHQWAVQQLFTRLDEGIFIATPDGKVSDINPALERILQYPTHLILERQLEEVLAPEDEVFFRRLSENIIQHVHWEGRVVLRRADQTKFPAFLRLMILLDDRKRPEFLLGVLQDLSPIEETHARLHLLTHHDKLTRLQNRASFLDEVDAILRADRQRLWLLTIISLDRFTIVHDTLGPTLTDRILVLLANRLRHVLNSGERLARLADHDFALLTPLASQKTVDECAFERAKAVFSTLQSPFELKKPRFALKLTGSFGMATFPRDGRSADELVQAANLALNHAKVEGGNQYAMYKVYMTQQVNRRFHIEQGLRYALERREIECFMQPLVSAQTGQMEGFECLMRWRRQEGFYVSPVEFVPIAEETGLIIPLTHWLLDQACQHLASWRKLSGKPLFLSLNLSPRQLLDPKLPDSLLRTLRKYHLDPTALMLEITETELIGSIELVREHILQLAMNGFLIAIDDFGTGHSTLSLLNELPIDKLKIDQSFIRDKIPHNPESVQIVKTMLALAQGLELMVVVEGIETSEQAQFIRQHQPSALLQGHFFSKPLSVNAWDGQLLSGCLPDYTWWKKERV